MQNVDAATLCSGVIAEHFLEQMRVSPAPPSVNQQVFAAMPSNVFDVGKWFPDFPSLSIELAQQFVDESLKMPGTSASFSGPRGISIKPNFVFVEYLQKRRPGGIGVSFYGSPEDLRYAELRPGRTPSYSRAIVVTKQELKPMLEVIRRSYQLKFGHTR
jgi:hypothetical protein